MKIAIAYYRVSTDQQGKSGLGLEAQQEAVRLFAEREGYQVATHYTEIESGKLSISVRIDFSISVAMRVRSSGLFWAKTRGARLTIRAH